MKHDISTGYPVADNLLRKRIADDIMAHALVTYFEKKGVLNRSEFFDVLNQECAAYVAAIEISEKSFKPEE